MYEYVCPKCHNDIIMHVKKYDQAVPPVCPSCKVTMKKRISAPATFIFKGSGFYATDYKK